MKMARRTRRAARRLFRACLVGGRLDEGRVREAVRRLAASRRRGSLPLLSHFHRLVTLDRAGHGAVVVSAVPLSPDVRASVEAAVARLYGPGVVTSFQDDPDLIGGMRLRVGSDVYDGSVRRALAALEEGF
jgi:F-type H+-transporting ATPase subunit delta